MNYQLNSTVRATIRKALGRGQDAYWVQSIDRHGPGGRTVTRLRFEALDPMVGLSGLRMLALRDIRWRERYGERLQRVVSPVLLPDMKREPMRLERAA